MYIPFVSVPAVLFLAVFPFILLTEPGIIMANSK